MSTYRFQSTRPHGARPPPCWHYSYTHHGFNPRARMGRDQGGGLRQARAISVSIHAPAWGATAVFLHTATQVIVSIHAPAWGATGVVLPSIAAIGGFNPRARMGRDVFGYELYNLSSRFQSTRPHGARRKTTQPCYVIGWVSIHAPAWGATA